MLWHEKWSFLLMISLVNINKSAKITYLFTINKKMLNGKLHCIVHYTWEGNFHHILQTDTWVLSTRLFKALCTEFFKCWVSDIVYPILVAGTTTSKLSMISLGHGDLSDVFLHLVIKNKPFGMVLMAGLTIKRSYIIMLWFLILHYSWYTLHKIPYLTLFLWVEILWKQTVSTEFRVNRKSPVQKIRWNYSISRCDICSYVNRLEIMIAESNKYLQYFCALYLSILIIYGFK